MRNYLPYWIFAGDQMPHVGSGFRIVHVNLGRTKAYVKAPFGEVRSVPMAAWNLTPHIAHERDMSMSQVMQALRAYTPPKEIRKCHTTTPRRGPKGTGSHGPKTGSSVPNKRSAISRTAQQRPRPTQESAAGRPSACAC